MDQKSLSRPTAPCSGKPTVVVMENNTIVETHSLTKRWSRRSSHRSAGVHARPSVSCGPASRRDVSAVSLKRPSVGKHTRFGSGVLAVDSIHMSVRRGGLRLPRPERGGEDHDPAHAPRSQRSDSMSWRKAGCHVEAQRHPEAEDSHRMRDFDPALFGRFENDAWQRKASGYHATYASLSGHVIDRLLDEVDAKQGSRLLDIGSGPGYVAAAAQRRGCEALGIDFAPAMVELARALYPQCRFNVGDAQSLDFEAASFDCITGNFVLHHVPRQDLALQEIRRVLVLGGRVALTAWDTPDRNRFLGLFVDAVRKSGAPPPPEVPAGPPMASSDDDYRTQLRAAGFERPFVQHVEWSHQFGSADQLWSGLLAASVRIAALIERQNVTVRATIHREFEKLVVEHQTGNHLIVPVAAVLFGGQAPAG